MVTCCVATCKNRSNNASLKKNNISFHRFPKDPIICKIWIKACNKHELWRPTHTSAMCSEHFAKSFIKYAKHNRSLDKSAVPTLKLGQNACECVKAPSSEDNGEIEVPPKLTVSTKHIPDVCRVCLATNREMYSMTERDLVEVYQTLTGIDFETFSYLPDRLCTECAQILRDFNKFREDSLKAHSVLLDNFMRLNNLKSKSSELNSIDREEMDTVTVNQVMVKEEVCDEFEESEGEVLRKEEFEEEKSILDPISIKPTEDHNSTTSQDKTRLEYEIHCGGRPGLKILKIKEEPSKNDLEDNQLSEEDDGRDVFENTKEELDLNDEILIKEEEISVKNKRKPKAVRETETKTPAKRERKSGTRWSFLSSANVKNMFTVTELSLEEQRADVEKRRESSNYKNALHKCSECYKGFQDEEAYNYHMKRHTTIEGEFYCRACKIHFKNKNLVKKHESAHHSYRFSCKSCPLVTTHKGMANLHIKYHNGTSYKCTLCPEVFTCKSTHLGHIRKKHPSEFACDLCGYSFASDRGIYIHKTYKHRNDKRKIPEDGPFCELCNIKFVNDEVYNRHLRISNRHSINLEPNEPKRKYTWKKPDKVMRDGDSCPITCEQCGLQLDNGRAHYMHFKRMHPDKNRTKYPSRQMLMCDQCGRMFRCQATLIDHRWLHTSEKPFKCDACDRRFQTRQQLSTHNLNLHQGIRYECDECGKKFSARKNLKRHKYVHSGLKPYKCDLCDKRFTDACVRKAHVNHEHMKKPYPKRKHPRKKKPPQEITQTVSSNDEDYNN